MAVELIDHDGCTYTTRPPRPATQIPDQTAQVVSVEPDLGHCTALKSIISCDEDSGLIYERCTICYSSGAEVTEWYEYPRTEDSKPIPEEDINMSGLTPAGVDGTSFIEETQQIMNWRLIDAYTGTVDTVLADAIAAEAPLWEDGTAVTAADLCDWNSSAFPCKTEILTDPTDATTAVEVTTDETWVGGVKVRKAEDAEKGGADTSAAVIQVAGVLDGDGVQGVSVSNWCFTFKREIEVDKNGNPV